MRFLHDLDKWRMDVMRWLWMSGAVEGDDDFSGENR